MIGYGNGDRVTRSIQLLAIAKRVWLLLQRLDVEARTRLLHILSRLFHSHRPLEMEGFSLRLLLLNDANSSALKLMAPSASWIQSMYISLGFIHC